jgi:hypothetical protein
MGDPDIRRAAACLFWYLHDGPPTLNEFEQPSVDAAVMRLPVLIGQIERVRVAQEVRVS